MDNVLAYHLAKKSKGIAYLLGAFFSFIGLHRFYLGDTVGGVCFIVLSILSIMAPIFYILLLFLTIFDLFYTSKLCDDVNKEIYRSISRGQLVL